MNNNYILQSDRDMLGDSNLNIGIIRIPQDENIDNLPLAMAYVPWQRWNKTYTAEDALEHGTIFPELYLPFKGKEADRCGVK